MKSAKPLTGILLAALTVGGLAACSGGSSGGIFNQAFNVSERYEKHAGLLYRFEFDP